ncbi:putative polyhydroxyalkanoate system protein [Inhella inkyongensis]|uniref:Putative polyhydroxyalkanoate system protein n=1 Tax=Inhella inkyongensis TaxID=392593 RepID=A0A840S0P1_9BURK|nr:polyhydroxyalkanoic acid system family protein [Inhella inkyongensis]MBB5204647.1 putative polyhydroxyalkanoate system protein [Inhella inkyongensis]
MSSIRIHRDHHLGLKKAREVAWKWAEDAEAKLGMECTVYEGEDSDTIEFTRSGVKGELVVDAETFELKAKLGLLLGALRGTIEAEIERELDELLAAQKGAKAPKKRK